MPGDNLRNAVEGSATHAAAGHLRNGTDAYFGYQTTKTPGGTLYDTSNIDLLRPRGGMVTNMFAVANGGAERSMQFTLDDVAQGPSSESGVWVSGSHNAVTTGSAPFGSYTYASGAGSGVLDAGYDRFTVPMYGGFQTLYVGGVCKITLGGVCH